MNVGRVEKPSTNGDVSTLYEEGVQPNKELVCRSQFERATLPEFPKAAWRGSFAEYRTAVAKATEASDVFHFASLLARFAVALGRRVRFYCGMDVFPNVFLVCYGPTGDRKTTATRMAVELGSTYKVIRGGGSGEGLADEFSSAEHGQGLLIHAEEFSQILKPGRWDGSTLKPFLTQCFDCPERYQVKFRKRPIDLDQPTPSLLAATTPEWFWQDFSIRDFQGGFGNRILFFAGERKPEIALPERHNLQSISSAVDALTKVEQCEVRFDTKADELWGRFYHAWNSEDGKRDALLLAAVQRIPVYVLKLSMVYAANEQSLPLITRDQLAAAILVGRYCEACASELLLLQHASTNPRKELERRILALLSAEPTRRMTKREIYRGLWRHYKHAEDFDRAMRSLERAGELFTKSGDRGRVWVSLDLVD